MITNESITLEEAYDNLISNVSLGNIHAFLKACWLIEDDQTFSSTSLERIIYAEGDQQEIYTRAERKIVSSVSSNVYSNSFQLESTSGNIDCHFFVVELASESNIIHDAIATMKILNKAIDGLNEFLFITSTGIHFGCAFLPSSPNMSEDCMLSYVVNDQTNWEELSDLLLFRDNSRSIFDYYQELITVLYRIKYCYSDICANDEHSFFVDHDDELYDNDIFEDSNVKIDPYNFYFDYDKENEQFNRSINLFEEECLFCMSDLSGIKKTHANPLEMLFEAEKALHASEQESSEEQTEPNFEQKDDLPDWDLLDDPIALMKKLKKDRGI